MVMKMTIEDIAAKLLDLNKLNKVINTNNISKLEIFLNKINS